MGRYYYSGTKDTTEGAKRIELGWLRKHKYLDGYRTGNIGWSRNGSPTGNIDISVNTILENPSITLSYKVREGSESEWTHAKYSHRLESTQCNFGGIKWYFICSCIKNGVVCGNRVRILYLAGKYFVCRKCADLTYETCNTSKRFRTGFWKVWSNNCKAEDYYMKYVKRQTYKGKPTKAYRKYLGFLSNFTEEDLTQVENELMGLRNI
jgi:hypothetical protein